MHAAGGRAIWGHEVRRIDGVDAGARRVGIRTGTVRGVKASGGARGRMGAGQRPELVGADHRDDLMVAVFVTGAGRIADLQHHSVMVRGRGGDVAEKQRYSESSSARERRGVTSTRCTRGTVMPVS